MCRLVRLAFEEEDGFWIDFQGVSQFRGETILHLASRAGRLKCCSALVETWGARVNLQDEQGTTPLLAASIKGRHRIVSYLLQAGSDPGIRGTHKNYDCYDTALGWARRLGHGKVVEKMEEYASYIEAIHVAKKVQLVAGKRPMCTTPTTQHNVHVAGEAFVAAVEF